LQRGGIGLLQEQQRVFERQVAPAFAKLQLHVVDEQVEILHIARDRACHDWRRIRL